jgi:hypothetical protein
MSLLLFFTCFGQTMCPSSGEITVPIRHLVFVTLYRWLSGTQGVTKLFYSALHTRQSSIWNDKYRVSHRYGNFPWWWAHSCPKHVEKSNKHIKKKLCTKLVLFTRVNYVWFSFMQNTKIMQWIRWLDGTKITFRKTWCKDGKVIEVC